MRKKILCVAIVICMIAGMIPATSHANENIVTPTEGTGTINVSDLITDIVVDDSWDWIEGETIAVGSEISNGPYYEVEIYYVKEKVSSFPTIFEKDTITAGSSKTLGKTVGTITTSGNWKVCGSRKGGTIENSENKVNHGLILYPTDSSVETKYTVSFQMNGQQGTPPADILNLTSGSKISAPTAPTAAGYTFGGWYKEAGCINAWDFASDTVTADTVLYAKWTDETIPVITGIQAYGAYGYTEGTASVQVKLNQNTPVTYQWYSNSTDSNVGGTAISGATSESYILPTGKKVGDYFYCVVTATGNGKTATSAAVTIDKKLIGITWGNTSFTYDGTAKVPTATATGLVGTDTCAITVTGGQTNANADGTSYTATATSLDNNNYKLPANPTKTFTIAKAAMTVTPSTEKDASGNYKLKVDVTNPTSGYTIKYGETNGNYNLTESPKTTSYGTKTVYFQVTESSNNFLTYSGTGTINVPDGVKPTGSITVGGKTYSSLVSSPTFSSSNVVMSPQFTISGKDNESGVDKIYYFTAQKAYTKAQLDALKESDWKTYSSAIRPASEGNFIVYAKVVDKAGNVSDYISTDGFINDETEPKISGVKDEGTYCNGVSVTVTDTYLSKVTVDEKSQTISGGKSTFTLTGDGKEHTILAEDKAGNETEYTVKTNSNHKYKDFEQTKVEGEWSQEDSVCEVCGKSYKRYRKNADIMAEEDPSGGSISMDVEVKTGAPSTSVKGLNVEVAKKLVTDAATRAAKGEDVLVYLNVSQQTTVVSADKTATENAIKQSKVQNLKEGMYLDLSMYKKLGSSAAAKIDKVTLTSKVTFSMKLPENLKAPAGKNRTYYMVRIHNGAAEILNTTLKDNEISFETDRFSTYSIWYTEVDAPVAAQQAQATGQKDKVPQTSDNNNSFCYILLCLLGAIGTVYFGRKSNLK